MNTVPVDAKAVVDDLCGQNRHGRVKDALIARFILANGIVAVLAIVLIFVFLLKDSFPAFQVVHPWKFFTGTEWVPEFDKFGIVPLVAGSFFVTVGAVLISVPFGVACAVYLAEVAPRWIREILKPTIEVLAGIPSVVIGFIGLTVAAPLIQSAFKLNVGFTALTASVMLAFMAMPTIISISEDAIVAVPKAYRDGSLALGASRWETIRGVVVPSAKSGIVAACMLGVGRAIGETMTVLMVAGNAANLPGGLTPKALWTFFTLPVRTMTAAIAQDMGEIVNNSVHYHALFAVGLTLFAITLRNQPRSGCGAPKRKAPMIAMNKAVKEKIAFALLSLSTLAVVVPVVAVIYFIVARGAPAISWSFLSQMPKNGMREGGILSPLIGTFCLLIGTLFFAVPVGVFTAIYLTEYAKKNVLTRTIRLAIVNLAGYRP